MQVRRPQSPMKPGVQRLQLSREKGTSVTLLNPALSHGSALLLLWGELLICHPVWVERCTHLT